MLYSGESWNHDTKALQGAFLLSYKCFLQGSWQSAIKYRLKTLRKTKRPHPKTSVSNENKEAPKPKVARRDVDRSIPEMPEGETNETCVEHVATMKKGMGKTTNRNLVLLKELMEITFPYRRTELIQTPVHVSELLVKFPALQLVSHVSCLKHLFYFCSEKILYGMIELRQHLP